MNISINKKKYLLGAGIAFILITTGFFIYQSIVYRTEISEFDLKVSNGDGAGISQNSHFILKTTAPLSEQVLAKYVKMSPEVALDIEKVEGEVNLFKITPEIPLEVDNIYSIFIEKGPLASKEFSWAYQVKAPFAVTSSIPGEQGVDVPTNTGVEIYFNRDNIIDPDGFFEITPAAPGKFEVKGNILRFIPKSPLQDKTVYTIKIKSGLKAKDTEDVFEQEKIIQFETGKALSEDRDPQVYFSKAFTEIKPESDVILGVQAYKATSAEVKVYRLNSAEDFTDTVSRLKGNNSWAKYYGNIEAKLPENKKIFSGTSPFENSGYYSFIRLPEKLKEGYYAIVISTGKSSDVSFLQVNRAASFAAFSSQKSLLWLKDIAEERGIAGVTIHFNNTKIGETDSDGVALFETSSEFLRKPKDPYYTNERKFLTAKIPTGDLVIPVESEYGTPLKVNSIDAWWDYVSLNKNIYLPTDTLRFWAIGKARSGNNTDEEVTVKLTKSYWEAVDENIPTYAETKLKISEFNAITGELSFSNLQPGTYELNFSIGEEIVARKTVTVSAYVKPAYKIELTPDRSSIFAGENISFKVKAEFFDGTPVANTDLVYSSYGDTTKTPQGTIKLNSEGQGSFVVQTEYKSSETYWPSYLSVMMKPLNAEEADIETISSVYVFGPHIQNSIEQRQGDGNIAFSVTTRVVIPPSAPRGEPYFSRDEYLGGPVGGAEIKVDILEIIYHKDQSGTSYDPINKLTYPTYTYRTEEKPISSSLTKADQNGIGNFSFTPELKKTYKLNFSTNDGFGRIAKESRYVYGSDSSYSSFRSDSSYSLYNPDGNKNYKLGDQINLELKSEEGVMPQIGAKKFIFLTVNNGNIEYQITDTPKYQGTFKNKDVPNISIWPGWFSEGRFHNSYLKNISFDANERRLNIQVNKDKAAYKPGENVKLDIRVTDKNNKGVKSEVNISALDEAVFTIRPDETDIVSDLYQDIYSEVVIRTSNMPPYGGGGAERGGGGGDEPRSNIQEMAIYKSIITDASGYVHVEFKLPDNITSWRLTSQAITKDLYAGKKVDFIPVTLPFFIDVTLNKTYLSGDDLIVRLRSFGTAARGVTTNYIVESSNLPFGKINKVGGESVEIPLGKIPEGNHVLTVRGENGGFKDALTRTLNVRDSYFVKNVAEFFDGTAGIKIKTKDNSKVIGLIELTMSASGRGQLYKELESLTCGCGIRLDQKGSEVVAEELMKQYFSSKNDKAYETFEPKFVASKYQAGTGGLRLLPYSSEDLELSAMAAHLFSPSVFDRTSLQNYFSHSMSDEKSDPSRLARALYGLSAFKAPVLVKIQRIKNESALKLKDKVFLALALDALGAKEEARSYYKENIKPSLEIKSSYAYVDDLKSHDETITTTALVAALTARLEEPESGKLATYLEENFPRETLVNFEKLLYIKGMLPRLNPEEVSFEYKSGGKSEKKTLKDGESFKLFMTVAELENFELSQVTGKLGVIAKYEEQSSSASVTKDKNLTLARSYEINGVRKSEFKEGDLVMVRLIPNWSGKALTGQYQIVDYLPSGLRAVGEESTSYYNDYSTRIYPSEINDQKITFILDKNSNLPVYYFARVVSKGTYKAEAALLGSLRSLDSATVSNEESIKIR